MASASFRESMNSMGWSRREPDMPVNISQQTGLLSSIKSLNPFGDRYVQLPTTEGAGAPLPASTRREEEEGWFASRSTPMSYLCTWANVCPPHLQSMADHKSRSRHTVSRWDRMLVFAGCNIAALSCFVLVFALWPVLWLKPSKLAILWSFGSVLFLCSWAAMMGPMTYIQHLLSGNRLPFTAGYFGSIFLTLFFALGVHSALLTLMAAIVQLACLVWYLVSYFPMGSSGLRLATSFGARRAAAWMTG
ncbi:protein transport protein sft2 [Apiospora saccharicola]